MLDLLDTRLDPREVEKAMDIQMATLIEKDFAKPRLKADMPRKAKLFNFKWVDEIKRGVYRSRFTCADIKRKYSKEELATRLHQLRTKNLTFFSSSNASVMGGTPAPETSDVRVS